MDRPSEVSTYILLMFSGNFVICHIYFIRIRILFKHNHELKCTEDESLVSSCKFISYIAILSISINNIRYMTIVIENGEMKI